MSLKPDSHKLLYEVEDKIQITKRKLTWTVFWINCRFIDERCDIARRCDFACIRFGTTHFEVGAFTMGVRQVNEGSIRCLCCFVGMGSADVIQNLQTIMSQ